MGQPDNQVKPTTLPSLLDKPTLHSQPQGQAVQSHFYSSSKYIYLFFAPHGRTKWKDKATRQWFPVLSACPGLDAVEQGSRWLRRAHSALTPHAAELLPSPWAQGRGNAESSVGIH